MTETNNPDTPENTADEHVADVPKSSKSIKDVLKQTDLPSLEIQMILSHALEVSKSWLIAHDDDMLNEDELELVNESIERRQKGEPMAYIVGEREFMGLPFKVHPAVLIPRPDTELLANRALEIIKELIEQDDASPRILDIGTGSGALAVSIKHFYPEAHVWASDISVDALALAKENARLNKMNIEFVESDLFSSPELESEKFDIIISNPPYIHPDDKHLKEGDVAFEPTLALTDGKDGLQILKAIIDKAPSYLINGGALYLEHGWDQAQELREFFEAQGCYENVETLKGLDDNDRVTGGFLKQDFHDAEENEHTEDFDDSDYDL